MDSLVVSAAQTGIDSSSLGMAMVVPKTTWWMVVLFGAFGGSCVNLLTIIDLKDVPRDERPIFDWIDWMPFLIWPLTGGVLTLAYLMSNVEINPLVAINTGISAPLLIRSMVKSSGSERTPIEVDPNA